MTSTSSAAVAARPPAARNGGKGMLVVAGVGAALAVVGAVFWVMQLTGGMVQTGMRNLDSWGLYITCFMFFVGLSAGGLIISSIPNAFGMEGFGGVSKVAIWTSVCCTIAAVTFVVVDLGGPLRLWELFVYGNFTSPLMWDLCVITTYLVLSVVYLVCYLRHEAGKLGHAAIRAVSVVALVTAVMVHSVTAWIFSLNVGREMWHTALMAPWFVSSALVCGTALVLVVVIGLRRMGYLELEQRFVVKMAKMLGAFCCVDLYFFACDLITEGFPGGSGAQVVSMLTTGVLAPFFWTEVIGCALCAVVCFAPKLRTNSLLAVGGILAIVGIFCKRVQLLVGGFQLPSIDLPMVVTPHTVTNWSEGLQDAYAGMVYWPAPIEWLVTLGVLGLATALLFAGLRWLPLRPTHGGE